MKAPHLDLGKPGGFTLIELLIVISIIALLATLGLAGGTVLTRKARELEARTAMTGLQTAVKGYKTEYLRLPSPETTRLTEDNEPFDTSNELLLNMLLTMQDQRNPKGIRFWEPPPAKPSGAGYSEERGLIDPWGKNGYKIILDFSGDGRIANPYTGDGEPDEITADIVIYCAGANLLFEESGSSTGKKPDDLKSWQ
jgi:prepilin-type N-terminal cleavage/methylation domain-containing protein